MTYLAALARYHAAYWWLVLTRRKHEPAPQYLLDAYNAQARAWNKRQNKQ